MLEAAGVSGRALPERIAFRPCERPSGPSRRHCTSRRKLSRHAARLFLVADLQEEGRTPVKKYKAFQRAPIRPWISPDGQWRVRPVRKSEVQEASILQADAFYQPKGLPPLDCFLQQSFQGEVWGILNSKLDSAAEDGFCCLVAEHATQPAGLLGIVEVSIQSEKEELMALSNRGLEENGYAYLTSMAVRRDWRRRGIASALLSAAERMAGKWWQNWVLLHVYESDAAGSGLYQRNGYVELKTDPPWGALLGRRQRVLMAKNATMFVPVSPITSISSISSSLIKALQRDS